MANLTQEIEAAGIAIEEVLLLHALTFRVGNFNVAAADVAGNPVHLTLTQAITAIEAVLAGNPGTIQSGDISITFSEITPTNPAA